MRKTKYFIMGFIFLLFLNSCGYLPYIYEQAVVAAGGNPYKNPKPKKDAPNAIDNPKYKQKVELLLQDILNRDLKEKNIYYVDGRQYTILMLLSLKFSNSGIILRTIKMENEEAGFVHQIFVKYEVLWTLIDRTNLSL